MGIKLSQADQIKLLRGASELGVAFIKILSKVDFDEGLLSYANDLSAIKDVISDSCTLSLKTEDEIEEYEHEATVERMNFEAESSAYNSKLL